MYYLTVLVLAITVSSVGSFDKIDHLAHFYKQFMQIPVLVGYNNYRYRTHVLLCRAQELCES